MSGSAIENYLASTGFVLPFTAESSNLNELGDKKQDNPESIKEKIVVNMWKERKTDEFLEEEEILDYEMDDIDACLNGNFEETLDETGNKEETSAQVKCSVQEKSFYFDTSGEKSIELIIENNQVVTNQEPTVMETGTPSREKDGNIFGDRVSFDSITMPPPKAPPTPIVMDNFDTASTSGRSTTSTNFTSSTARRRIPSQNWRLRPENQSGKQPSDMPRLALKESVVELKSLDEMLKSGHFATQISKRFTGSSSSLNSAHFSSRSMKNMNDRSRNINRNPYPKREESKPENLTSPSLSKLIGLSKLMTSGFDMKECVKDMCTNFGGKFDLAIQTEIAKIQNRPMPVVIDGNHINPPEDIGKGVEGLTRSDLVGKGTGKTLSVRFAEL